jgi:hypothetical protein
LEDWLSGWIQKCNLTQLAIPQKLGIIQKHQKHPIERFTTQKMRLSKWNVEVESKSNHRIQLETANNEPGH